MAMEVIIKKDEGIGELDFSFDAFKKQKVIRGVYAYARLIDRLIRKRKGSSPSEPNMGIDLDSYRFQDIDLLVGGSLKNEITKQLTTYIPNLPLRDVEISTLTLKNSSIIYISISIYQEESTLEFAYMQRRKTIVNSKITVKKQNFIQTIKKEK